MYLRLKQSVPRSSLNGECRVHLPQERYRRTPERPVCRSAQECVGQSAKDINESPKWRDRVAGGRGPLKKINGPKVSWRDVVVRGAMAQRGEHELMSTGGNL